MNIKSVHFLGLFDRLDYNLDFSNFNMNILTGPNGYGKTIILKSINNLINGNLSFFEDLKFKEFKILIDTLEITIRKGNELYIDIEQQWNSESLVFIKNIKDIQINTSSSIEKIEMKWQQMSIISTSRDTVTRRLSEALSDYSVLFVKDQRINNDTNKKNEITLISLANDLKEKINTSINEYNKLSQELDASFPMRIFETPQNPNFSILEERLKGLKLNRNEYVKYGFLEESNNMKIEIQDIGILQKKENSHVLDLYISDSLIKYSAFDNLVKKINLFLRFLNSKELSFKEIIIHKDFGFCAKVIDSEEIIELKDLSSGEQNQIIMLYKLIFQTDEKTILLIDEPEISLHIAWQREILNNLERIMKVNAIPQTIIATHSPTVINGNWDKSLDLYELSKLGKN